MQLPAPRTKKAPEITNILKQCQGHTAEVYPPGPVFHLSPGHTALSCWFAQCSKELEDGKVGFHVQTKRAQTTYRHGTNHCSVILHGDSAHCPPPTLLQDSILPEKRHTENSSHKKVRPPPQINTLFLLDYLFNKYYFPPFHRWNTVVDAMRERKSEFKTMWFFSPGPQIFHL